MSVCQMFHPVLPSLLTPAPKLRGNHEKAARYTTQLYDARCNGQWQNVPELARKVEKHAPNRIRTQTLLSLPRPYLTRTSSPPSSC